MHRKGHNRYGLQRSFQLAYLECRICRSSLPFFWKDEAARLCVQPYCVLDVRYRVLYRVEGIDVVYVHITQTSDLSSTLCATAFLLYIYIVHTNDIG